MVCRVVGGARAAVDGQAECLEDRIFWADVFELESGVRTTEGWPSLFFYYMTTYIVYSVKFFLIIIAVFL